MKERPVTLAGLRDSGWKVRSVKEEMRANLIDRIERGETVFPGIHGYEQTVIPALENAILARHDVILLGLRGQAKTRLLRALTTLLDDAIPIVEGCAINDSPFDPRCLRCRRLHEARGDDLPVEWIGREDRYREKLATPDVTVADLIGDIDPIKAANLRLSYSDEEVIHYGIIPRTNRGIFAINELPDLAPRIQVSLLNILEERDLQIRGFPVRIPLDLVLVFSANPEDYTSRGNIITPLKDRIDSQILTHYPRDVATAVRITAQEAWLERCGVDTKLEIPPYVRELIEQIAFVARRSELVDQSSGVSARLPIAALEILVSNLERRAARNGEREVFPRLADFQMVLPAVTGKVEMVYEGEQQGPEVVARRIVGEAVGTLLEDRFPEIARPGRGTHASAAREKRYGEIHADDFARRTAVDDDESDGDSPSSAYDAILAWFAAGNRLTISDQQPFDAYFAELSQVTGLADLVRSHVEVRHEAELAFWMEVVLEGLHQAVRLAREDLDSTITFAEMMKFNVLRTIK